MQQNLSKHLVLIGLTSLLGALFAINYVYFKDNTYFEYTETQQMMDTYVTVTVYHNDEDEAQDAIDAAFNRMREIENIASINNSSTEAYQLNENKKIDNPSPELLDLVEKSIYYYNITNGSFDITVQPLLELWAYDPDADTQFWDQNITTQQEAINETMQYIGSEKITITKGATTSIILQDNMSITLGGIAKGYAVDEAINVLRGMGIKYALINAGGDIATLGSKPNDKKWTVALQNPDDEDDYITNFKLKNMAIATSGNYERYFNKSKKVGHIMNPKTGFSAYDCSSVTIIAQNCTEADVLATAVFVMGPVAGLNFVNSYEGVETLIVGYDNNTDIYVSTDLEIYED